MRDVQARRPGREGLDLIPQVHTDPSQPVPVVDPNDLRAVWELTEQVRAQFIGEPSASFGIEANLVRQRCGPGTNVFAAIVRCGLIEMSMRAGITASQMELGGFDVAATFPIPAMDKFNPEEFIEQLARSR
jgi:hypothetical protein